VNAKGFYLLLNSTALSTFLLLPPETECYLGIWKISMFGTIDMNDRGNTFAIIGSLRLAEKLG